MSFELENILYETEDFFRRAIGTPGMRAAKKRRAQRRMEEFGRRAKRSGFVFVFLLAALLAVSIFVKAISFLTILIAIPTALLFAIMLMFQPSRHARRLQAEQASTGTPRVLPLDELLVRAEEGLLDRCDELPGHALPAADRIMARLRELQPHLGALDPDATLAGDARRLIGQHLPQLIDAYLQLPDASRAPRSESSRRLAESLDIVAGELDHLLDQCCRDKQSDFDTHSRFIETRYREDDNLRGE